MNTDISAGPDLVCCLHPFFLWTVCVVLPHHHNSISHILQFHLQPLSNGQINVLLHYAFLAGAFILTAMACIHRNDRGTCI